MESFTFLGKKNFFSLLGLNLTESKNLIWDNLMEKICSLAEKYIYYLLKIAQQSVSINSLTNAEAYLAYRSIFALVLTSMLFSKNIFRSNSFLAFLMHFNIIFYLFYL